ncbi:hypothetical protein Tco_0852781 [Tanacetum coccineum]
MLYLLVIFDKNLTNVAPQVVFHCVCDFGGVTSFADDEPVLSSLGGLMGEKVTGTNKESALYDSNYKSGPCLSGSTSYAKLVTGEPSRKSVNFCTLIAPEGNGADLAISVKFHGVPMTTFIEDGLSANATKLGTPSMRKLYTSDTCMQSWGRISYARAMIELPADVELKDTIVVAIPKLVDECRKNIVSDMVKNLRNSRQAVRGVQFGPKVGFNPTKQVYILVSYKNNANTSGKRMQAEVSRKEVSNSKPFDVLNLVEKDNYLGTNGGNSKSVGKGANSGVSPSDHRFFHVVSSSTINTYIVERIDKLGRHIIDGKLTLVDDDVKPLPKVVSNDVEKLH